ncbi:hypothetical protein Clacol_001273 [Clathrus columnatus]|uniref:Uncharacterized protein n=1 Tax=Clathrus columnatus TaxID=1419009 RepID=A0AAV5A2V3_9AGAM|nr:hypothetical protein Clacol_001273 [Clathrus columnatus]
MPHLYLTGSTSSSQSVLNDNRLTSSPDPLISAQNELDAFGQGNFVLVAPFTDDEDENNPPNYFSGVSNPEPLSPILDEEVITRTGEASRLRRRGALHGRRRQLTYVTLSCGVELPWRFKFEGYTGEKNLGRWNSQTVLTTTPLLQPRNGSIRSGKLPLEYPSTGCRAILTNNATILSYQNVYSATEPVDSVRAVDEIYVDEEQKEMVKEVLEVLAGVCHSTEWKPVACCQCGNVVGFRYSQTLADQHGHHSEDPYGRVTINRFAFFPSTVTSSKPYNFAEGKFYSESSSERPPQFQPIPTSGADPTLRTRSPRSLDSLRFEPLHRDILPPQDGSAPIQVRLPSTSRNQSSTHLSNTRPMSSENLLPSIPEGPSATESTHQDNADIIWGRWLPNPYAYSSDTENGEAIERELERRRLGLSEAISILQTTHQEFMAGHQDSYDGLEESESRPRVGDAIPLRNEGISEDINQPSVSDEPTQVSNPYPYTHLSSSAPVPLSISTRTQDAGRLEQHTSNGNHSPSSTPFLMSEPLTTTNNDFSLSTPLLAVSANARSSDQTLPLPTHLPISYDSPAAISDIEASNSDTGAVENVGIMVEVAPPPQNFTSNLGSAAVVPSLIGQSNDASRPTQRNAVESTHPTTSPNHSSLDEQETNDSTIINFGFDTSAQLYPTMNQQYPGFEPKIENLFNMEVMAGQLPNVVGEAGSFGPQLTNSNVFQEYTPSLSPLSPGALATPSLPYSPTSSVPLPPTLLPLIEILDSIEMEVLPLARHSDLEDSDTSSQASNTDSDAESQNNVRDESVYTTELPWDCYDPDPSWLDYEGPPFEESPIAWLTEPIDSALPFSASVFENPEASE